MAPVLSKLNNAIESTTSPPPPPPPPPPSSSVTTIGLVSAAAGLIYWLSTKHRSSKNKRSTAIDGCGGIGSGRTTNAQTGQNALKVDEISLLTGQKTQKKDRAHLDRVFLRKLSKILKIIIPGWRSTEAFYLFLVAACLLVRTYADMWMISNGTSIERSIIGRERHQFFGHLVKFVCAMPVIAAINNVLKYGLCELKLRFRHRLSSHLLEQYMGGFTYYKMSNLDNRICNADQLLTQDVEKFSDSLAEVYSSLCKPLVDIIIYVNKLSGSIGAQGPITLMGYLVLAGVLLSKIRRPIGRLTITEQRLEGEFRYVNSRIIVNSEEIAFYRGGKREKATLDLSFKQLVNHLRKSIQFKFMLGLLESVMGKYAATVVGYLAISRPFLDSTHRFSKMSHSDRLEDYYKSGRMLIKMAEAVGRLVLAGREMTRLAGFTSRVSELIGVIEDLKKGRYERTMIADSGLTANCNGTIVNSSKTTTTTTTKRCDLIPGRGRIIFQDNIIRFDHVPLVTPNGDVLIRDLNFEVHSGMNVLVCGPNGCGKSSLFRILGELWPLFGGILTKPDMSKLFYIPQKPYMTLGSLRDQLIYPDCHRDQMRRGITDTDLVEYLDIVQLTYILDREGGWESMQDWQDVLSGGEKQRIAMARLFYHKPQFAILDECTSAVSVDVEGSLYQYCREMGITLFTVSHRKSLWAHHEFVLQMDGRGSYVFDKIDDSTNVYGS